MVVANKTDQINVDVFIMHRKTTDTSAGRPTFNAFVGGSILCSL